ncbi:MAG: hypothetical protein IPN42_13425 [Methylococcaceae bacterium]|nr:hypothetical protein [Methylococcaceae bacterium]
MALKLINRLCIILLYTIALASLPRDSETRHLDLLFSPQEKINIATVNSTAKQRVLAMSSSNRQLQTISRDADRTSVDKIPPIFEPMVKNETATFPIGPKIPLKNQNVAQLWESWKTLLKQGELQQIPIVNALLAGRIRKNSNPSVYQDIQTLLQDADYPFENKALLLDLLTEIATPEALNELLKLTGLDPESPLYAFILQAISRIGDNRWDGRFHEELSPTLEAAWSNPEITDESLLSAIGTAIAEVGAPNGIEQLLQSISATGLSSANIQYARSRQPIAYSLSGKIHNPKATKSLSGCIDKATPNTPAAEFCINALGGVDNPMATEVLLEHAENAADGDVREITNALDKVQSDEALKLIAEAPKRKFQSPKVEEAISTIASEITASTVLSPAISEQPLVIQPLQNQ